MHFTPRAEFHPGYCAVTGHSEDPEGFIDTGNTLRCIDPRVLVSTQGVKTLARMIGWEDPAPYKSRIEELESDNEHLLSENEKAREAFGQIQGLENKGFQIKV